MGWEKRANGKYYYYRKRRLPNGKVISIYVGTGPRARLQAQLDALARLTRATDRRMQHFTKKHMIALEPNQGAAARLLQNLITQPTPKTGQPKEK